MTITFADLEVGQHLPAQTFPISRANLVQYAGASGDFNPIHWSEQTALGVGLPNVIAHGMLTMAIAVRVVTDWLDDPGAVLDYGVRFTRPVVVEFDQPANLEVTGSVRSLDEANGTAVLDVIATVKGETVLAKARVTVRVAE
ncbi:MAG: MaoC family dehydratase N-terminal domain-containing protein [Actinomycetota bacterium]|nr:MaoC family dehydratase N-terminal domain-containing protein [Actinomycetota bacterium]MDQ2958660.1 MaoC family dehydratase N-terminal domain-containing protein [Actinomycetota bacterium]